MIENSHLKDNIYVDQNNILALIMISYIFKIIKLIIFIFTIAWYMGILYYIYCDISNDLKYVEDQPESNNFIKNYMEGKSNGNKALVMLYFMFTTLSSVGFGDYHPINSEEAAFTAFVLLFGCTIFSYLMGNFIEIADSFLQLNEEFDDGD